MRKNKARSFSVKKQSDYYLDMNLMADRQAAEVKRLMLCGDAIERVAARFQVSVAQLESWWRDNSAVEERNQRNAKLAGVKSWVF